MSDSQRFSFDTNVLFYASDSNAGEKHRRALILTEGAIDRDCVLMLQSLGELASAMIKKRAASAERAHKIIQGYRKSFPIVASTESDLEEALRAHIAYNTPFWDAMLWATARRNGCTLLFTEDFQDGRNLEGVTIQNPFAMPAGSFANLLK